MSEANKLVARSCFEEQNRLRVGPADTLCAAGHTINIGGSPPMDLAVHKEFSAMVNAAVPDLVHAFESLVAEADRVAMSITLCDQLGMLQQVGAIPTTGQAG